MRKLLFLFVIYIYSNAGAYDFSKIDSIINAAIANKYFPGAQLLIGTSKNNLYFKSYGTYTYNENSKQVDEQSLFDIASLTKVVATTPAIMILLEQGKLKLEDKVIEYIPEFNNNGKENITILNLMLHNSGLKDWLPFYKFCSNKDEVLKTIYEINLEYTPDSKCLYSDLNFILLGIIVERISGLSFDKFCEEYIFSKLGMNNTFFNPGERYIEYALPTEYDKYWRKRQLQGEVHDESAALLEGVSGNAGLFSNAQDLYKYTRTLLSKGTYKFSFSGNTKSLSLFKESTVNMFTGKYTNLTYSSTRALGWDTKPEPTNYRSPCGENISENSFGHTGYTGTSIWCDKDRDLIIIFLTNRVYPNRNNNGLKEFRPDLHNYIIQLTDYKQ